MQIRKKFMSLSIAFTMMLSTFVVGNNNSNLKVNAEFEKNASEVVEDITFGWNLGNTLDSYSLSAKGSLATETSWGNPTTTQEMIDMVKDTGINAIRVPVTWFNHMDSDNTIDEEWLNRVEEVVNYVIDEDTYCIINVHHDTGEKGWLRASSTNLEENKEKFTLIWEQISETFADYGDHLLFEGFNEILNDSNEWVNPDAEAVQIVNELNQVFVDTVRNSGGNNDKRNLIVNTYCAGGNNSVTKDFVLPNDTIENHLIVEAHIYQPFYFTSEFYPEVTTWGKAELNNYIGNMYDTFVKNGTPVIIGEFGCANKNNMSEIISWAEYYVETCKNYGIKCFWWDNGSQYKLFNRRTLKVAEPDLLNTMLYAANGEKYTPDTTLLGDVNNDGLITVADVKLLKEYILIGKKDITLENADLNSDNHIDVIDVTMLKNILCSYENLCEDENNWSGWVSEDDGASGEIKYNQNGITVDVYKSGSQEWHVQGNYQNITLEEGATYQLDFDYSATKDITLNSHLQQNYDPYGLYQSYSLDYTTEVQHFTDTFTMSDKTDNNVVLVFNCGGVDDNTPFSINVQNLKLIKISDGNSSSDNPPTTDITDTTNENLCENMDNWIGYVHEVGNGIAEVKYLENGISIDVTQSGDEEWYIQGCYQNITLEEGATYQIEFDYLASKEVPLYFHIQQNYEPYGLYKSECLDYTTEVQHYKDTITMTEKTDNNVTWVFNCGGVNEYAPFSMTITNLSLVKIS